MHWKSPEHCGLCRRKLIGKATISTSLEKDGSIIVIIRESRLIDWAYCRSCGNIICRESCWDNPTGLCKPCAHDFSNIPDPNFFEVKPETNQSDDVLLSEIIF